MRLLSLSEVSIQPRTVRPKFLSNRGPKQELHPLCIAVCTMLAPFVRKFGVLFIMVFTTYFGYQLLMFVFGDEISTPYGACPVSGLCL